MRKKISTFIAYFAGIAFVVFVLVIIPIAELKTNENIGLSVDKKTDGTWIRWNDTKAQTGYFINIDGNIIEENKDMHLIFFNKKQFDNKNVKIYTKSTNGTYILVYEGPV